MESWRALRAILLCASFTAACGGQPLDDDGAAKGGGGSGGAAPDPLGLATCESDVEDWNVGVELAPMSWSTDDDHSAMCALRALDVPLADKRVVCSSEDDHGVAESSRWHASLARYLVHRSHVRVIAYEMSGADAEAWNRYIESGDEADLEKGFDGTAHSLEDVEENGQFIEALRAIQLELPEGEHLRFVGFDIAVQTNVTLAAVKAFLEVVDPSEAADWVAQLSTGSYQTRAAAAGELVAQIVDDESAYTAASDAETYRKGRRDARNLEDGFEFLVYYSQGDFGTGNAKYREPGLIRNMEEILANTPDGERVMMVSHDIHCAKHMPASGTDHIDVSPALGTHLAQSTTWGPLYSVIGQLYQEGTDTTFEGPVSFVTAPNGIEKAIGKATAADALLVSTTSTLVDFHKSWGWFANGQHAGTVNPFEQFDGIIWLRHVTPTTLR